MRKRQLHIDDMIRRMTGEPPAQRMSSEKARRQKLLYAMRSLEQEGAVLTRPVSAAPARDRMAGNMVQVEEGDAPLVRVQDGPRRDSFEVPPDDFVRQRQVFQPVSREAAPARTGFADITPMGFVELPPIRSAVDLSGSIRVAPRAHTVDTAGYMEPLLLCTAGFARENDLRVVQCAPYSPGEFYENNISRWSPSMRRQRQLVEAANEELTFIQNLSYYGGAAVDGALRGVSISSARFPGF